MHSDPVMLPEIADIAPIPQNANAKHEVLVRNSRLVAPEQVKLQLSSASFLFFRIVYLPHSSQDFFMWIRASKPGRKMITAVQSIQSALIVRLEQGVRT